MASPKTKDPGPASLFRGKVRKPVSVTLTLVHHRKVTKAMKRIGLSRSDLIALLIDKHAHTVTKEYLDAYAVLRQMVETLGGSLKHVKRNEPRGGTWVLTLGDKEVRIPSEQARRYPPLDACYKVKEGVVVPQTWDDHEREIDPAGLAKLFAMLASAPSRQDVEMRLDFSGTDDGDPASRGAPIVTPRVATLKPR